MNSGNYSDDDNQWGGWKNLDAHHTYIREKVHPNDGRSYKTVFNEKRSYRVFYGNDKKQLNHVVFGAPIKAARKAVGILNYGKTPIMPSIEKNNAVYLLLEEITPGVMSKKTHKEYKYEYYGWRERLTEPKQINLKNNKHYEINWINRAVRIGLGKEIVQKKPIKSIIKHTQKEVGSPDNIVFINGKKCKCDENGELNRAKKRVNDSIDKLLKVAKTGQIKKRVTFY